ncbi:MAG TPA: hypothetical protein VGF75_04175 [Candidatus Saccharimonadales bacterium]|jgi:hypothetical protein
MDDALNTGSWQPNTFMDIVSPRVKNSLKRSALKSNTLMRSAVRKPDQPIQVEQVSDYVAPAESQSEVASYSTTRPDFSEAARVTDRSPLVSRFSANQYQEPVATELEQASVETPQAYPSMDGQAETPVEALTPAAPETLEAVMEQPSINIFKNALPSNFEYARPSAKAKKSNKFKRLSGWSVLTIVVVGLAAGGLFINSNLSKFELYLASSRAGFSAKLPSVRPSGYSLSGISTGSGVIEASFKGNSGNRDYTISEKKSSVSSTSLMNNYVQSQAGMNFQTINTAAGNTIYVYKGHDATWASNGIWYVLQDNNTLSDHQIIDIASSM